MRILFDLLGGLLPEEAKALPIVTPAAIGERVRPLVKGLLPSDWQDVALHEISQRVFVLNFQGARKVMEAKMSWIGTARSILWAYFEDFGLDLDSSTWLATASHSLERLLAYGWSDDPALRASRRKWLARLDTSALIPELLAFWKRNLHQLVPDPGNNGPSYKTCADWAKALWELNPASYKELLQEWSTIHQRRRNLWSALWAMGLPCDLGK